MRYVGPERPDARPVAVALGCVHYCHHTLAECNCLLKYATLCPVQRPKLHIAAISVHSLYYLSEKDLHALWRTGVANDQPTMDLVAVLHRPELGALPANKPEFRFVKADDAPDLVPFVDALRYKARQLLYGQMTVLMVPIADCGTLYVHDQLSWLSTGYHSSFFTRWLDEATRGGLAGLACYGIAVSAWYAALAMAVYYVAQQAYGLWQLVVAHYKPTFLQRLPLVGRYFMPEVGGEVCLQVLAATCFAAHAVMVAIFRWMSWATDEPGFHTDMTVTVAGLTTIADGSSSPAATVLKVSLSAPRKLTRVVFTGMGNIEPEPFNLAMVLYAQNPASTNEVGVQRVAATIARRFNHNYLSARETARMAADEFIRVNPNGQLARAANTRRRTCTVIRYCWSLPYALACQVPLLCTLALQSASWVVLIVIACCAVPIVRHAWLG